MSEHTNQTSGRQRRQDTAAAASANNESGNGQVEQHSTDGNTDHLNQAASHVMPSGDVTLEIAGLNVTLPVKFAPGMVLTDKQAKVLDAAYQRQFTNNQNASAKSRAEAYGKAANDAERASKVALTAEQISALYADYEPSVGGTRMGSMEKNRNDAAWRAWVQMVKEHNAAIDSGAPSPIFKAQTLKIIIPTRKVGDQTVEQYRDNRIATVLQGAEKSTSVAERVQVQLDAIMAEKGSANTQQEGTVFIGGADDFA